MLKNPLIKAMMSPQKVSDKVGTPILMSEEERKRHLEDIGWHELTKDESAKPGR